MRDISEKKHPHKIELPRSCYLRVREYVEKEKLDVVLDDTGDPATFHIHCSDAKDASFLACKF